MFSLENVMAYKDELSYDELELMYEAKSIKDMLDVIEKNPDHDWSNLLRYIESIKTKVLNKRNIEPEVYKIKEYSCSEFYNADRRNKGDVLFINIPGSHSSTITYSVLKQYTLEEIKDGFKYTNCVGSNYLRILLPPRKMELIQKMRRLVDLYTEQVERQALVTKDTYNLFMADFKPKNEIVIEYYKSIINYLISNLGDKEFFWFKLSPKQKIMFMNSINSKHTDTALVRNELIKYITLYLTLPELEEFTKGNEKVLNRLMK